MLSQLLIFWEIYGWHLKAVTEAEKTCDTIASILLTISFLFFISILYDMVKRFVNERQRMRLTACSGIEITKQKILTKMDIDSKTSQTTKPAIAVKPVLAAVNFIKFAWVGKNKKFRDIWVSPPMSTNDLLKGNYLSFFDIRNRGEIGNCQFMMELLDGDTLLYENKTSQSDITIHFENDKVIGIGIFNTYPLEEWLSAADFISIRKYPF